MDRSRDVCLWTYRPGTSGSHWAYAECNKGFNPLTKLPDSEPYIGVADFYNGKLCPCCGKTIEINYDNLKIL